MFRYNTRILHLYYVGIAVVHKVRRHRHDQRHMFGMRSNHISHEACHILAGVSIEVRLRNPPTPRKYHPQNSKQKLRGCSFGGEWRIDYFKQRCTTVSNRCCNLLCFSSATISVHVILSDGCSCPSPINARPQCSTDTSLLVASFMHGGCCQVVLISFICPVSIGHFDYRDNLNMSVFFFIS